MHTITKTQYRTGERATDPTRWRATCTCGATIEGMTASGQADGWTAQHLEDNGIRVGEQRLQALIDDLIEHAAPGVEFYTGAAR